MRRSRRASRRDVLTGGVAVSLAAAIPQAASAQQRAIVIGAGIAGLSVASALARRGMVVTVVDREEGSARGSTGKSAGIYRLAVSWIFSLLQLAILVRVVMSWVRFRPGAWYSRWAFKLSEPILRPIRNIVPMFGMVDISPIVAWFGLLVVQSLLLGLW